MGFLPCRPTDWDFGRLSLGDRCPTATDRDRNSAHESSRLRRLPIPDVLEIREIKKPAPDADQILVKVRAASVNPLDWHYMEGTPYIMRLLGTGLRKPKNPRLGVDMAGQVEAVGKNVTQFKPGDEVFGVRRGAFAEYVVAPSGSRWRRDEAGEYHL